MSVKVPRYPLLSSWGGITVIKELYARQTKIYHKLNLLLITKYLKYRSFKYLTIINFIKIFNRYSKI